MSFRKKRQNFLSADGKTKIACYFYEPEGKEISGVVQISHGMCEYVERYQNFIGYLCENGFAVCGNDHLGHGKSAPDVRSLGFFAEKDGAALIVEDLHQMTELAKKRWPGLPLILFGHSMGSFAARQYLRLYGEELDGAVICGTAGSNPAASAGIAAANAVIRMKGARHRSKMLDRLAFGSYNKRFTAPKGPHAWLTRDEVVVKTYDADPYCNFLFTAAGFRDLFTLLTRVSGAKWAESVPKTLPVLLTAGEDDPVGNYGKGVREVEELLRKAGVSDVTLKLYPGARHEILNEINREEPYQDICSWMKQVCQKCRT